MTRREFYFAFNRRFTCVDFFIEMRVTKMFKMRIKWIEITMVLWWILFLSFKVDIIWQTLDFSVHIK